MPAAALFETLRITREDLPPALREAILALGHAAVGSLVEILQDDSLDEPGAPGDGWPPIHAVDLLADLKAPAAIEPMVALFADAHWDTIIHEHIAGRLPEFGQAALEPILAKLGDDIEEENRSSLVSVLAQLGVQDDRIFEAICDVFEYDVVLGATAFQDYGDRRALPLIENAILGFEIHWNSAAPISGLTDLEAAYAGLAGRELPDALREHVDAIRQRFASTPKPARSTKVGRNLPCPCGSGKKYKKCCLDKPGTAGSPG